MFLKGYSDPDPDQKFWIRPHADPSVFGKVEGTGSLFDLKYVKKRNTNCFDSLVHIHENRARKQYILSNVPDRAKMDVLGQI